MSLSDIVQKVKRRKIQKKLIKSGDEKMEEIENRKIEIVGKKIFENIKKYGTAHHLMELRESK